MTEHVKIYGVKPRIQYTADGILTEYEFPFAIFSTSDIDVYFGETQQESTSYTVSEARHSDGGTVTFESAPAAGTIITIVRNLSIERTSDFQEGSTLRAKVLNDELDYQIACTQQIAENLNRSMVLPPYAADSGLDLTLPTPSAGKAIVWNADGTNLENSAVAVNNLESTLKGYKEAAESAAATATGKAELASDKADMASTKAGIASDKADMATTQAGIASDKADIATAKAAEAASTLSVKANKDLDNLSDTGKAVVTSLVIPDYDNPIEITSSPYTATKDGLVVLTLNSSNHGADIFINTKQIASFYYSSATDRTINAPVAKGDIVTFNYKTGCYLYPMKGSN